VPEREIFVFVFIRTTFKAMVYDLKDCSLLISSFRCWLWLYSTILTIWKEKRMCQMC